MLIVASESTTEDYALRSHRDKHYQSKFEMEFYMKETPEQANYSEIPF